MSAIYERAPKLPGPARSGSIAVDTYDKVKPLSTTRVPELTNSGQPSPRDRYQYMTAIYERAS